MNKIKIEEMSLNIYKYGVDLLLTKNSAELLFEFINKLWLIPKCNSKLLECNYNDVSINGVSINKDKLISTKPMIINISSILGYIDVKSILDIHYIGNFDIIPNLIHGDINEIADIVNASTCDVFTITNPKLQFGDISPTGYLRSNLYNMYLYRDANGHNKIIMCTSKDKNSSKKILIIEEFLESSVNKEACYQVLIYKFNKLKGCYEQDTIFHNEYIRHVNKLYDAEKTMMTNTSIVNSINEHTNIEHYTDEDAEFKSIEKVITVPYKHFGYNMGMKNVYYNNITQMLTAIDPSYVDDFNIGSYLENRTSFTVHYNRETSIESEIINNDSCCYVDKLYQPVCKYTGLSLNKNASDVKNDVIRISRGIFEKIKLKKSEEYCIEQIQKLENAEITGVNIQYITKWFNRNNGNPSTISSSIEGIAVSIAYIIDEHEHELISYISNNVRYSWYTNIRNLSTKADNIRPCIYSKQYGNGGTYINGVLEVDSKVFIYEPEACLKLDIRNRILNMYDTKKYLEYTVLLNEDIVNEIEEKVTNISSAVEIINKADVKILMSKFTLKWEDDYDENE